MNCAQTPDTGLDIAKTAESNLFSEGCFGDEKIF